MPARFLLCYITDRTAFANDEPTRRRRLLEKIAETARAGVDYIQLREKNLSTRELESLAHETVKAIHQAKRLAPHPQPLSPALLINSRTDVALAVGADGVHLRSNDTSPLEVTAIWQLCGADTPVRQLQPRDPRIGVSCHSAEEVTQSAAGGANFAVFGPVFEKQDAPGASPTGLAKLREACNANIPVLALGGISLENARECLEAGAAGIAAIRLFQQNDVERTVHALRQLMR